MIETVQRNRKARAPAGEDGLSTTGRRLRFAEMLAFVALAAALIGALGPAERTRTTFSWPPRTLPQGSPGRLWYTPLLLATRYPDRLAATLPCSPGPPLPRADAPVTVVATVRSPTLVPGLVVTHERETLRLAVGDKVLAEVAAPRADGARCSYELRIADERWSLEGGPNDVREAGATNMPVVDGILSALDLRAKGSPRVSVTTRVHGARTVSHQKLAWTIAVFCLVTALVLAGWQRRPRLRRTPKAAARGVAKHAHPIDGVIAVVLIGWWLISPAFWDDGWTIARQSAFLTTGGFSNYYDSFGASLPLGYWLEWTQHWLTQNTSAVLLLRVPALVCLGATWVLCRWLLKRLVRDTDDAPVLWTFAAVFTAGAMAWGMTLRQEPVVSLLVVAVLACAVRFRETKSAAPLAVAAVLVPLAINAHPAGVIAIAPLLLLGPELARWARSHSPAAATILPSAIALVVVLAFVGSDIKQRGADAQTVAQSSTTVRNWRDEIYRYDLVGGLGSRLDGYGTPLRRTCLVLIGLTVLAFLLRRQHERRAFDRLPAASLALSLVLLLATPSKWPWHFGVFIGVLALAAATEAARFRDAIKHPPGRAGLVGMIALVVLGFAWAWPSERYSWNAADLRSLEWPTPSLAMVLVLPLLLLAASTFVLARRRGGSGRALFFAWMTPALVGIVVAFTASGLAVDVVKSDSWTLTRQNLETLSGSTGCGLGDDLLVPKASSSRPLRMLQETGGRGATGRLPAPPVSGLPRFALATEGSAPASTPWFQNPRGRSFGVFFAGLPEPSDALAVEWARSDGRGFHRLGNARVSLIATAESGATFDWRFVTYPPQRRWRGANAFRFTLRTASSPASVIAVTAPVTYDSEAVASRLRDAPSLVAANIRTYFPCVRLPKLEDGIAQVPRTIMIAAGAMFPLEYRSSPFAGVLDMYRLERLPFTKPESAENDIVLFAVDQRIPGAMLAPPEKARST